MGKREPQSLDVAAIRARDAAYKPGPRESNASQAARDRRYMLEVFDQAVALAAQWRAKYEATLCDECNGLGKWHATSDPKSKIVRCHRCAGTGREPVEVL